MAVVFVKDPPNSILLPVSVKPLDAVVVSPPAGVCQEATPFASDVNTLFSP